MKQYVTPLLLAIVFFLVQLLTLSDYGINWDSPNHMMRGQAYAHFYTTNSYVYNQTARLSPVLIKPQQQISRYDLNVIETYPDAKKAHLLDNSLPQKEYKQALEKSGQRFSFYQSQDWNQTYLVDEPPAQMPLIDMLSGFSNQIFYQKLGLMGDIESYQLVYILVSALGIFIVGFFTFQITNSYLASLVSGLSLAFFPLFFAESHFNPKDTIQATFFAGSVWAFWNYMKTSQAKWFIFFGLFILGCLGTKWNILELPLIIFPWLYLRRKNMKTPERLKLKKLAFSLFLLLLSCFIFFVSIWPSAWANPFISFVGVLQYYFQQGIGSDRIQPSGFVLPFDINLYPSLLVFTQTPEVILFLMAVSFISLFGKRFSDKSNTITLLLLWIFVPIIRISLPHVWFYNGLRQIMEILPPLTIAAGIGFAISTSTIKKRLQKMLSDPSPKLKGRNLELIYKTGFELLVFFVILILLLTPIIMYHPNQNAYFNIFTGGLQGAYDKNMVDWTLTYGNVYKQGSLWLNQHAEPQAHLAFLNGSMFAISPLFLRDDISISPDYFSGFDQKGEYMLMLNDPLNQPYFSARYPGKFLNPVYEVKSNGVSLLYVYKNAPQYLKPEFQSQAKTKEFTSKRIHGNNSDYIQIDFGREVKVTGINLIVPNKQCFQDNNEYVRFIDTPNVIQDNLLKQAEPFLFNEKKIVSESIGEYLFPAEKAWSIQIYPQSENSCFVQGIILDINYVK